MLSSGRFGHWFSRLRTGRARRFARDERGATAVELAILAVPFFVLVWAIMETALVFLATQILDGAVQDSARLIRTGQAQTAGYTIDNFRTAICSRLYGLFNCNNLKISVKTVTSFTSASAPPSPLDPTDPSKWVLTPAYDDGQGSSVIMVQVYYKWPLGVSFGGFSLASSSDGTMLMGAVRVFKNEPFT